MTATRRDKLRLGEPWRHNYFARLSALIAENRVSPGAVRHVHVLHDDWCAYFAGGYCDCSPTVELGPPEPQVRA